MANRARPIQKKFHVTQEELDAIEARWKELNYRSCSAFLIDMALHGHIFTPEDYDTLCRQIQAVADRADQNDEASVEELRSIKDLLQKIGRSLNIEEQ